MLVGALADYNPVQADGAGVDTVMLAANPGGYDRARARAIDLFTARDPVAGVVGASGHFALEQAIAPLRGKRARPR